MSSDATEVALLADPIWTLIDAIANVNTYDGDFVDADGKPVNPPADGDGRVHAYAVYYPGPGWAHALLGCGGTDSLDFTFQVTCAGGDRTRALWCIQQVRDALSGKNITIGGQDITIRELSGPDRITRDDDISPSRFYAPLIFAINA